MNRLVQRLFRARTVSWWQIGLIKLSVLCLGIAMGAYWQSFFAAYLGWLVAIGLLLGVYMAAVWLAD